MALPKVHLRILTKDSTVTWDVIGEITYSQTLGFLENAADVDDILSTSSKILDYVATVSQIRRYPLPYVIQVH